MNKVATTVEQSRKLLKLGLDPATADFRWQVIEKMKSANGELKYANYALTQVGGNTIDQEGEEFPHIEYQRPTMRHDDVPAWSLSALIDLLPVLFQDNKTGKVQLWNKNIEQALESKEYDAFSDFYPTMLHGNKIAFGYTSQDKALFVNDGGEMGGYYLSLGVYGDWVDAAHSTLCWLLEHKLMSPQYVLHEPIVEEDEDEL